jgi:hypothetical protein
MNLKTLNDLDLKDKKNKVKALAFAESLLQSGDEILVATAGTIIKTIEGKNYEND